MEKTPYALRIWVKEEYAPNRVSIWFDYYLLIIYTAFLAISPLHLHRIPRLPVHTGPNMLRPAPVLGMLVPGHIDLIHIDIVSDGLQRTASIGAHTVWILIWTGAGLSMLDRYGPTSQGPVPSSRSDSKKLCSI